MRLTESLDTRVIGSFTKSILVKGYRLQFKAAVVVSSYWERSQNFMWSVDEDDNKMLTDVTSLDEFRKRLKSSFGTTFVTDDAPQARTCIVCCENIGKPAMLSRRCSKSAFPCSGSSCSCKVCIFRTFSFHFSQISQTKRIAPWFATTGMLVGWLLIRGGHADQTHKVSQKFCGSHRVRN
jgi:hypothetical protein